jgi:hypothetical protein
MTTICRVPEKEPTEKDPTEKDPTQRQMVARYAIDVEKRGFRIGSSNLATGNATSFVARANIRSSLTAASGAAPFKSVKGLSIPGPNLCVGSYGVRRKHARAGRASTPRADATVLVESFCIAEGDGEPLVLGGAEFLAKASADMTGAATVIEQSEPSSLVVTIRRRPRVRRILC